MEDTTNRLDKTLADLTAKDVIVIGAGLLAVRFCGQVASGVMAPQLRKLTRKIEEKTEKMKAETEYLKSVKL
jgi:hypothetical protein